MPTSSPPWTSREVLRRRAPRSSRAASRAPGLPASSPITWPSPAVIVSSGPIGAAPWETIGSTSTPSKPHADRAVGRRRRRRRTGRSRRRASAPEARPPSSGSIGEDSRQEAQDGVGRERHGIGEQDRAVGAGQVGHAGQRAGALLELLDGRVEGRRRAVAERGRPHRDGRARPRSRGSCPITPPAPQPIRLLGREHLVDRLQRRLRRREDRPRDEHDGELTRLAAERRGGGRRGLERGRPRVRRRSRGRFRCGRA